MNDMKSEEERKLALIDLHRMCPWCTGSGMMMDKNGQPTDCPHSGTHALIENEIRFALEGVASYSEVVQKHIEAVKESQEIAQVVVELTNKLQAIGAAARNVTTSLDEINDLVYADLEGSSVNQIRASVLREVVHDLHYPLELVEDKCVCGEAWDEDEMCSEARRMLGLADVFDTKENA